jgi:hypothetical protein
MKLKEILLIGFLSVALPVIAHAQNVTVKQPLAAGGGAANITSTVNGSHVGLDVNLPAGSVTLTVPPYQVTSGEFKVCSIPATSAASCNLSTSYTMFLIYNGSTSGALYANPFGTASATAGFPITQSGVAYDHNFGLTSFTNQNWSIYNAGSATATVMIFGGK